MGAAEVIGGVSTTFTPAQVVPVEALLSVRTGIETVVIMQCDSIRPGPT
jgi:hypothetical protein